jgi:hypothetical protein
MLDIINEGKSSCRSQVGARRPPGRAAGEQSVDDWCRAAQLVSAAQPVAVADLAMSRMRLCTMGEGCRVAVTVAPAMARLTSASENW